MNTENSCVIFDFNIVVSEKSFEELCEQGLEKDHLC